MDIPPPRPPWPTALRTALVAALVLSVVALATMALALRDDAGRTADALRAESQRIAAAVDDRPVREVRAALADAGVAARVVGPRDAVVAEGPLAPLWDAGAAPLAARAAAYGTGATLGDGVVEHVIALENGRRLITRAPLAMGTAGILRGVVPAAGLVALLALGAGGLAWRRASRRRGRLDRRAEALQAIAGGRPGVRPPADGDADMAALDRAVARIAGRAGALQGLAAARMDALGAVLAPLPVAAAARTPTGGLVRNEALERLVRDLPAADADRVEEAVREGLAGTGALARRIALGDGRALDCEAWAVPGGRVLAMPERTEQARLRALRADISAAAGRMMRGPLAEISHQARDLAGRLGGGDADAARAILAGADRLERIGGRIMRADGADVAGRAARVRPVGVPSLAFGLGRAYDRPLRERGLRLEHDIPAGTPAVLGDPGLLHEVLCELIDNAAASTPRGGVLTLRARPAGAERVELVVADTGSGIPARERALVMEPFGRGAAAVTRPGAGLGLGVARALVERMGGRLSIDDGEGGRVRIEMPAQVATTAAAVPAASAPAEPLEPAVSAEPATSGEPAEPAPADDLSRVPAAAP